MTPGAASFVHAMSEEREHSSMTEMVRLDRLAKRFGPVHAVEEVSFTVARGEVLGFLGPNGAGKSTTMRMLTGFITPSAGSAQVMGFDVVRQPIEVKRRVGYLPEGAPLYGDMTVLGFLRFVAEMRGLSGDERKRGIDAAIARTQLEEVAHRPIETLSKGFKRRVGLAQAIMHDPPVLVLDEPTDGLDPNQKHGVRELIAEMAGDKAIVISTHILEEVEAICTRAIIIARGRVVADATPIDLKRRSRHHNAVRITVNANLQPKIQPMLAALPGVRSAEVVGTVNGVASLLVVPEGGGPIVHEVGDLVRRSGLEVDEIVVEQGRLDDVFRELTAAPN
jgi:ABC-2 type transport system ATP-binding protein